MNDVAEKDAVFVNIVQFSLGKFGLSSLSSLVVVIEDLLEDLRDFSKFFWRYSAHSLFLSENWS